MVCYSAVPALLRWIRGPLRGHEWLRSLQVSDQPPARTYTLPRESPEILVICYLASSGVSLGLTSTALDLTQDD